MRNSKLHIFYNDLMVNTKVNNQISKSPLKPKLVFEELNRICKDDIIVPTDWHAFTENDFKLIHHHKYVEYFFHHHNEGDVTDASLEWSEELKRSVCWTNSSLYHAIKKAVEDPSVICLSPTSGFHHARWASGLGFCTFAGQVLASTKIYREKGLVGCYLDLDGHYGNSIEDLRIYVDDLNNSIPRWANFNPDGMHGNYVYHLRQFLEKSLEPKITNGQCHYVVWCHGADSHVNDDHGGQVNTEEWMECSRLFYTWLYNLENKLQRPIPVVLSLFGGYRHDAYESVINLHCSDIVLGMNTLLNKNINYQLNYK